MRLFCMSAKTRRKALDAVTKYAIQSFDKIKVLSSKVPTGGFIGGEILLGRLINGYMTDRALNKGVSFVSLEQGSGCRYQRLGGIGAEISVLDVRPLRYPKGHVSFLSLSVCKSVL